MGDVVTALARAVQEEGHIVEVVLPKYDIIDYNEVSRPTCTFVPQLQPSIQTALVLLTLSLCVAA